MKETTALAVMFVAIFGGLTTCYSLDTYRLLEVKKLELRCEGE